MNKPLFGILVVYVLIQLVYVIWGQLPFVSDSLTYLTFAQSALQEHTYYPNPSSLFSEWLVAPVYINWLILLLKIHNGNVLILFCNIVLNTVQLWLVYKVTEKIFNKRAALVAAVVYVLYLNNLGLVLLNLTELPFGIFMLLSIYLFLDSSTMSKSLLCGLAAGLAIGVRPTGWALVIAFMILCAIFFFFQSRGQHIRVAGIVLGLLLYIVPMGLLSQRNIGQFEFTSTTGPANLIMSANPNARGVFDARFFYTDKTYLTKLTYVERNDYLLKSSKDYIQNNFGAWLRLMPRKFYSTFISDGWAIPQLLHTQKFDLNGYLKDVNDFRKTFYKQPLVFQIAFWVLNAWQQIIYTIIFLLFIYQLVRSFKRSNFNYHVLLINLFIVGGLTLTFLSSVGNPRYKYNFLILAIILISPYLLGFFDKLIFWIGQKNATKLDV